MGKLSVNKETEFLSWGINKFIINTIIKITNTDIEIYDFKEIRYGRKVGAIEFYIRDNKEAQLEENEELIDDSIDPSHVENVNRIVGRNLSAGMVSKITNISLNSIKDNHVDMTVYEYIEDKVKAVKNYARSNTIRNYM